MRTLPPRACRSTIAMLLVPLLVAGCARHRPMVAALEPAAPPPPAPVLDPRFASVRPPARDADGHYLTINSGTSGDDTIWHVRAALNVAAIGCRGPGDAGTIAAYNAMLASKKALLARANATFLKGFGAGGAGQAASDSYMTRLYNFFAMPAAKPGFCAAAAEIAPEAAGATAADFPAFAEQALPKLEAPFLAVYRAVDDYRVALAEWHARTDAGAAPQADVADARETTAPRLAYADLGAVISWQPRREALASR